MTEDFSDRIVFNGEPIVTGFAIGHIFYYQDILTREFEFMNINENQVERHGQGPS